MCTVGDLGLPGSGLRRTLASYIVSTYMHFLSRQLEHSYSSTEMGTSVQIGWCWFVFLIPAGGCKDELTRLV